MWMAFYFEKQPSSFFDWSTLLDLQFGDFQCPPPTYSAYCDYSWRPSFYYLCVSRRLSFHWLCEFFGEVFDFQGKRVTFPRKHHWSNNQSPADVVSCVRFWNTTNILQLFQNFFGISDLLYAQLSIEKHKYMVTHIGNRKVGRPGLGITKASLFTRCRKIMWC